MQKQTITSSHRQPSAPVIVALLLLTLGVPLAQAHPGHAIFDHGFAHALTRADHLFLLAFVGGGLFCIGRAVPRRGLRRTLQWLGVGLLVGAGTLWKFSA